MLTSDAVFDIEDVPDDFPRHLFRMALTPVKKYLGVGVEADLDLPWRWRALVP